MQRAISYGDYTDTTACVAGGLAGAYWGRSTAPGGLRELQHADENWTVGEPSHIAWFRDLATIPLDMQFDIHFRVIDTETSAVVLESACYQYTVSQ